MTVQSDRDGLEEVRAATYFRYGRDFQDAGESFDIIAAARWGKAYRYYLRGWMPQDPNSAIAELACGTGKLLYFFRQLGYANLHGVDISLDQIERAREVVPNVALGNALNWLGDRAGAFDLVVALDLIEHFRRDEALRFLDLCFTALRPGGRLILQTPNADSPFGTHLRYGDLTHEWIFGVNLLHRLMRRSGFDGIEARDLGPVPWGYSPLSTVRWMIWQVIRSGLQVWNIAESGARMPVLTRAFLISAQRPARPA
jgi:SAM-dependent methyltransferase